MNVADRWVIAAAMFIFAAHHERFGAEIRVKAPWPERLWQQLESTEKRSTSAPSPRAPGHGA